MKILRFTEALSLVAKQTGRWCMYVSSSTDYKYMVAAAPYLRGHPEIVWESAIIVFDSKSECLAAFHATVGNDGPTRTNKYDGPGRVYALTCGPDGELGTENT